MFENTKNFVDDVSASKRAAQLREELARWERILITEYTPEKIILFGSFTSGKTKPWSDVDMVIIKNTDKSFLDRTKEVLSLLKPRVGLDVIIYTPHEFERLSSTNLFIKEEISGKGVVIYERRRQ